MEFYLIIAIFIFSLLSFCLSGLRILGANAHPLTFVVFTQVLILTVIGTISLSFFELPMSYGADQFISLDTKEQVFLLVFSSLSFLFFGLSITVKSRLLTPLYYDFCGDDANLIKKLTYVSLFLFILKVSSLSEIPLLYMLKGDVQAAAEAKMRILTNQDGITIFGINYILRSFTPYVYLASLLMYVFDRHNSYVRNVFFMNILIALANSLYDMQKQGVVFLVISTFWAFYIHKGKASLLIKGAIAAAILSAMMFVFTLGNELNLTLIKNVAHRVFLAQSEGMYFIREFIEPSYDYLWLGLPLSGHLGVEQIDPAAQVVKILFPSGGDAWVNSNTYFIAHAWTIFGNWAVVIAPIFVLANISCILFIGQILIKKRPAIFYPVILWFMIKLPLVNIFTEFLWFKVVLDAYINLTFVGVLVFLFGNSRSMHKNNHTVI